MVNGFVIPSETRNLEMVEFIAKTAFSTNHDTRTTNDEFDVQIYGIQPTSCKMPDEKRRQLIEKQQDNLWESQ